MFIRIAERHAGQHKFVHFLHAEQEFVALGFQNASFHFDIGQHQVHHGKAALQVLNGWKKLFFQQLQVAVVPGRQVGRQHRNIAGQRDDLVASCANEFKHVGIFFVRHDAGAGREFVGKLDESKILVHKQTGIHGLFG